MRGIQSNATIVIATAVGLAAALLLRPKKKKGKQVILITGASRGIGKATALKLLQEGHIVFGAARSIHAMKDIEEAGGHVLEMDVCNDQQITQGVEHILQEQNQRLDVLINNAGISVYGALEIVSMEDARRQFEVNLFGVAALTKAVLPSMRKNKSGTIINVSSGSGKIHAPYGSWYHASKHALEGLSDCCRLDLKEFGINVVIVEPGMIQTGLVDVASEAMADRSRGTPYETSALNILERGTKMAQLGSDVSVVAQVMSRAVNARRPKRRYVVGATIRELLFIRNWLGDAVYDALMLSMLK